MIRSTVKCKASNKMNEENEFEKSRDRNDSLMGIVEPLMGMYGYRCRSTIDVITLSRKIQKQWRSSQRLSLLPSEVVINR